MEEFLVDNASAIFAILGTLIGAVVTGAFSYLSKTKETKLRLTEKLLDKKLEAHESLIDIAGLIRTMVILGGEDSKKELKRCPLVMSSRKNMADFLEAFSKMQQKADPWISSSLKKEISFFLDYFVNLNERARDSLDSNIQEAGVIVRDDFIDISTRLEGLAHDFFNKDMLNLNYKTDRGWHKHPIKYTLSELDKTEFYKNKDKVIDILKGVHH